MLRLVSLELEARTVQADLQYSCRFSSGLNVLAAPNSWGKSTLVQSIVYGLGLEGMISASRQSPLGEAMTRVADTGAGQGAVFESSVTLTVENAQGQVLRTRRFPQSVDVQSTLVQTWQADSEQDLADASQVDLLVREAGGASRDLGFHYQLERFIGWELPTVPNFAGGETLLYMEHLFPLFYVEQKFGWSGVAPRMPTHYRIRDPLRRSVEFVLGLSSLDRIKRRARLRDRQSELRAAWKSSRSRLLEAAAVRGWVVQNLPEEPIGLSQLQDAVVVSTSQDETVDLEIAAGRWRDEIAAAADEEVALAGPRTEQSRQALLVQEREVRRLGAEARAAEERVNLATADLFAIDNRLAEIEVDRSRLRDVARLRTLGSTLDLTIISDAQCPTCEQELDGRSVATGAVRSVDETASLALEERQTMFSLREAVSSRLSEATARLTSSGTALIEARIQVRLLKDELTSPSSSPSYAEVRRRLDLEDRVRLAEHALAVTESVNDELSSAAVELDSVRAELAELGAQAEDPADLRRLRQWSSDFVRLLDLYELKSVPTSSIVIDSETLLPVDDGVELAFDVSRGLSASDSVRTKWAYYVSLLRTCSQADNSNHAHLLILDEPRQQEISRTSLRAFLLELSSVSSDAQVLYATSEAPDELATMLDGIEHVRIDAPGDHLLTPS